MCLPRPPRKWIDAANDVAPVSAGPAANDMGRRCPILALSPQQAAASRGKGQHKAKLKEMTILPSKMPDPAMRSKGQQRAANGACSGC